MIVPNYLALAFTQLGVKEHKNNRRIYEYLSVLGFKEDVSIPWCTSFIAWVLKGSGMDYYSQGMARAWGSYGQDINPVMRRLGDLVVLWRDDPSSSKGHLGFLIGEDDNRGVYILGGNQSNMVTISPYASDRVLGIRRPVRKEW